MRQQLLTLQPSDPITIATASGLITIRRGEGRWRLVIQMPESMRAFKGSEGHQRALNESGLLEEISGVVRPIFRMLVPVLGQDGSISGVTQPTSLRVGAN